MIHGNKVTMRSGVFDLVSELRFFRVSSGVLTVKMGVNAAGCVVRVLLFAYVSVDV